VRREIQRQMFPESVETNKRKRYVCLFIYLLCLFIIFIYLFFIYFIYLFIYFFFLFLGVALEVRKEKEIDLVHEIRKGEFIYLFVYLFGYFIYSFCLRICLFISLFSFIYLRTDAPDQEVLKGENGAEIGQG
jgi:hypothetical protein